jgi:hypothetical protein
LTSFSQRERISFFLVFNTSESKKLIQSPYEI